MRDVSNAFSDLSRNTVIRRLNDLSAFGIIEVIGRGRSTRYRSVENLPLQVSIPVSFDAIDIEEYVTRPVQVRRPVGYNRSFLEQYTPNVSQYLPDVILDKMYQAGRLKRQSSYLGDDEEARRLYERFLIDISYASSRLEGANTNYLQTERLIRLGKELHSMQDRATVTLILNHKNAIEFVLNNVHSPQSAPIGFNRHTVFSIHAYLTSGLLANPDASGRVRRMQVDVSGSAYTPENSPVDLEDELVQLLNKCEQIEDPFEQSFFALLHLSYLQAFEDGNKRTARIVANIPLLRADLCPVSFLGTPETAYINGILGVYELNRTELIRDVYVSTYMRTASHFHGERGRMIVPGELSFRYRTEISRAIRALVTINPENPLDFIEKWSSNFAQLTQLERENLRHVVLEDCRNLTAALSVTLDIEPENFHAWDRSRTVHYSEIQLPSRSRESTTA